MNDLKYLNDILVTLEYNIKGLQVVLQKTMSDTYFLKVENRLVDTDLLYSCTTFIVVTYKPALDVLNLLTISYKCEIMSSCELRYHDIDTELDLPTYVVLIRKLLLETHYSLCAGAKEEYIFTNFNKVHKEDLVKCLVERSPISGDIVYRSSKCKTVYPSDMLLEESGQCAECNNLFASFFSPQESAEKEDLRCPYAECRKLFRRLGSYKKHLCVHAEKVLLEKVEKQKEEEHELKEEEEEDDIDEPDPFDQHDPFEPGPVDPSDTEPDPSDLLVQETTISGGNLETTISDGQETIILGGQETTVSGGEGSVQEKNAKAGLQGRKKRISKLDLLCASLEGELSCAACSLAFSKKTMFVKHQRRIHADQYQCDKCDKSFAFEPELKEHCQRTHDKLTCGDCGAVYANRNSLTSHQSAVHRTSLQPCYMCGKWMKKSSIAAHIRLVHDGEEQRNHLCNICGNGYKTKTDLDRHYTKHTGQKKYTCSVCGKGYRFWGGSDDCLRRHNSNLRYECTEEGCSKGFNSKFRLKQHIRTHSGVKPFQCPLCEYDCTRKDNLQKHIKGTHKYTTDQIVDLEKTAKGFKKV